VKDKWRLLAFLCGIFCIYTVDRSMLGILAVPIQRETGIGDTAFGVLNAAIFWTYAALVPLAGLVGDRFDRLRLIGCATIAWSVLMLVAGFANGFWALLLFASFGVTVPQTLYGPAANALIAMHHRETRATALSLHQAAYYTGWFVSGAACAAMLSLFGTWRSAYFAFGAIGILVGGLFLLAGRASSGGSSVVPDSIDSSFGQSGVPTFRHSLRAFFGCPSALLAGVGHVSVVFVGFAYSAWGPKFVALKFSLSPERAGAGVMFWHYAAAFAAILLAGLVTDVCVRSWPRFRLILQASALFLAAPMLVLFGFGESVTAVFAAAALFGVLRGLFEANAFASLFDVIRPECRASAVGFLNVFAGIIGSFAPILLGLLSDRFGRQGFDYGFAVCGGVLAVGALSLTLSFLVTFRRDRR